MAPPAIIPPPSEPYTTQGWGRAHHVSPCACHEIPERAPPRLTIGSLFHAVKTPGFGGKKGVSVGSQSGQNNISSVYTHCNTVTVYAPLNTVC